MVVRRKGIAVTSILVLVGGVLFASVIAAIYTESPLRNALDDGADEVSRNTDYVVDIDSKYDLSDLAMLVNHRARGNGCAGVAEDNPSKKGAVWYQNRGMLRIDPSQNPSGVPEIPGQDQQGYPALSDTYLGQIANCYGSSSTPLSNANPVAGDSGNDMEGVFSREKFEVTERVVIETVEDPGDANYWLQYYLWAATEDSYSDIASVCGGEEKQDDNFFGQAQDRYFLFFGGDASSRVDPTENLMRDGKDPDLDKDQVYGPYCRDANIDFGTSFSSRGTFIGSKAVETITLCPGDKGVIGANKGYPGNEGESTIAMLFPSIRITEFGEDCGGSVQEPRIEEVDTSINERSAGGDGLFVDTRILNRGVQEKEFKLQLYDSKNDRRQIAPAKEITIDSDDSGQATLSTANYGLGDTTVANIEPFVVERGVYGETLSFCYLELDVREKSANQQDDAYSLLYSGYKVPVDIGACLPSPTIDRVSVITSTGPDQPAIIESEVTLRSSKSNDFYMGVAGPSGVVARSSTKEVQGGNSATFSVEVGKEGFPCQIDVLIFNSGADRGQILASETKRVETFCSN